MVIEAEVEEVRLDNYLFRIFLTPLEVALSIIFVFYFAELNIKSEPIYKVNIK